MPILSPPLRWALAWGSAVAVGWACNAGAFACSDDGDCGGTTDAGVCEASGWCSFPDGECASGRRYGSHAGGALAGACVDEVGSSSGSGGLSTSTSETSAATTLSTTLDGGATSSSSSGAAVDSSSDGSTGTSDLCPDDWWDCGWVQRIALDAAFAGATDDLLDVPVLVRLTPERADLSSAQPGGADLRVVTKDGTLVPHEIERFADGELLLWVRWPSLAVPEPSLVLYWNNGEATDAADPPAVWSNGYLGVWHLADGTDSLATHPLAADGTAPGQGRVGDGTVFDNDDRLAANESLSTIFTGPVTLEAWILADGSDADAMRLLDNGRHVPTEEGWGFGLDGSPGVLELELGRSFGRDRWVSSQTAEPGSWHFVAARYDGKAVAFHYDGMTESGELASTGAGRLALDLPDRMLTLGGSSDTAQASYQGALDEVRISSVARSDAWLELQYLSITDALLIYGAPESLPPLSLTPAAR
ncbi:MAG: LamG domain-containing protein [Nannocystaceae bacterium]|nr:LamG domain-containing protein [Nannocystaceae bacterium]